jgi:DNA-binding CsgD family transcriptional regulator
MAAERSQQVVRTAIHEHEGDLFVFMPCAGTGPGALNINTVNGDVFIFANCSVAMIEKLRRRFAAKGAPRPLSLQQHRCLRAAMQGLTSKQIARKLHLSSRTVEQHLERCRERLGARTTLEAAALARAVGIGVDSPAEPCPLTPRQLQCLRSISRGAGASAVAAELGLSINGVNFHLKGARDRLGTATTRAAVAAAIGNGWFDPQSSVDRNGQGT